MSDRESLETTIWKRWHKKIYVSCLRKHLQGDPVTKCDRTKTDVIEGRCSMEFCPLRDE